jgi:rubrerythrin
MGVMKIETRTWKDAVTTYTGEATATLVNWYNTVDSIAQKTGLDNIASKVKAVTDESKALKEAILGNGEDKGVIGALTEELQAVSDLTGGYANLRTTIQGLIADYEELLESVVNA